MRYFVPLLLPLLAFGGWTEFRTGPFQVITEGGDKDARLALNYLEQLRNAVGIAVGQQELESVWPIRVIVVKSKRPTQPVCKFARDAYLCSVDEVGPETASSVVDILLTSWPGHVPPNIRRGLLTLYSTLEVDGTRVSLGAPPATKDRDWSRAHMLAVQPEFSGKLRVLLSNLGKGIDPEVSYKNAFEKTPAEVDQALNRYIEQGQYGTIPVSGKPINPRQFIARAYDENLGKLAVADLAFSHGTDPDYAALGSTEGQGLVALRKGDRDKAKTLLAEATGAYALVQYAKLLPEAERRPVLEKAAAANPKWAEPYKLIAAVETHPAQKLQALRKATQLDPHDAAMWTLLAQTQESAKQMADAAKSWAAAERTTDDPEMKERLRQSRAAGERARAEADMRAREEARRKTEQELQDLRNRALMEIRQAEARANAGKPVIDANTLDEYKEGGETKTLSGVLARVDCQGTQAVLNVRSGRSVTKLLVVDPSSVEVAGGEKSFGCGVQKPARKVEVQYEPGATKKVTRIEFR